MSGHSHLHGYICECPRRRCRERVWLTQPEYERLSRYGAVVSNECGRGDIRRPLLAQPAARVLPTFLKGAGDVGL